MVWVVCVVCGWPSVVVVVLCVDCAMGSWLVVVVVLCVDCAMGSAGLMVVVVVLCAGCDGSSLVVVVVVLWLCPIAASESPSIKVTPAKNVPIVLAFMILLPSVEGTLRVLPTLVLFRCRFPHFAMPLARPTIHGSSTHLAKSNVLLQLTLFLARSLQSRIPYSYRKNSWRLSFSILCPAKVEEFHPLEDNLVRMYACGPTVYDYGHIGNFRTFIVVDTLRRFLKQSGYQLKHVMNITDVDDKIIRNAARDGVTVQEYTKKYREAFLEDADALNIEHPELIVNATDHIQEMAHFIAVLVEKGYAYRTDDGSYYFRIAKFPEYGKLSKKDFAGMADGARVDVDEYDKDNARDFALWKAPKPGEAQWETEIGPGRPGWHIECSTMSMKYLGESFRHPSAAART